LCARAAHLHEGALEVDELVRRFVDYYLDHPIDFTRWMPGARDALDTLASMPDMKLAICTNKPRRTTDAVLGALGIRTRFRAVCAGGDLAEKKPAAAPLYHIAKVLGLDVESLVMVGDGPQDVECARRAGVRSIAIEGFGSPDRLMAARPDVLLHDLSELAEVIRRWRDATVRARSLPPKP
jgi:phosphoglycolate phosphatase